MLDSTHQIIAGIVLLTVVGIAFGGRFVFTTVTRRFPANDLQRTFFRAPSAIVSRSVGSGPPEFPRRRHLLC